MEKMLQLLGARAKKQASLRRLTKAHLAGLASIGPGATAASSSAALPPRAYCSKSRSWIVILCFVEGRLRTFAVLVALVLWANARAMLTSPRDLTHPTLSHVAKPPRLISPRLVLEASRRRPPTRQPARPELTPMHRSGHLAGRGRADPCHWQFHSRNAARPTRYTWIASASGLPNA